MEEEIERDLEDLKTLLLHDNLFNYAILKRVIIMGRIGIILLGEFHKDPMGQTQHATGYLTMGKRTRMLDLDVYYVPYSRRVILSLGRVTVEMTMDEVKKILEDEDDEEEE